METLDPLDGEGSAASEPGSAQALQPGDTVDHFRVMRRLGRGGMGEVYLARDIHLGRKVALKLLHTHQLGSEQVVGRLLAEARITAHFNHPHIVSIYAVGQARGVPYMALEYMEGETLRERMQRERLGARESMRLALAIAEALTEAHRREVLHRDLKPGNVYIGLDGRLRVLDFGLAKALPHTVAADQTAPPLQALPSIQGLKGSPHYMAPEQWSDGECTGATDVWALGVILFELLAGQRPYPGAARMMDLALVVTSSEPVPALDAPHLPPELSELVTRCLDKAPAGRPAAAEVAATLQGLLAGQPRGQREQCPFPGLLPYSGRFQHFFFGRDGEVAAMVEQLRQAAVCPVVGSSGAGKSSFVQAGVIPRLQEDHPWLVLRMRPGTAPFRALAARLRAAWTGDELSGGGSTGSATVPMELAETWVGPGPVPGQDAGPAPPDEPLPGFEAGDQPDADRLTARLEEEPLLVSLWLHRLAERQGRRVLLFVDQLEELFTLVGHHEARRFMEALLSAAEDASEPVRVIFTLRDDFLGRLPPGPGLRRALGQMTVIAPPGAQELRQILERPLAAVGYAHDDAGLVDAMLAAVAGQPAALPLLSFTMRQLWDRRDRSSRKLRAADYEAMGGVQGALARHARGVLEGLSPTEVDLTRQLLLRMVTPDRTRKVLTRDQLLGGLPAGAVYVLDRLVEARLVASRKGRHREDAELELAHESLIQRWQQLRRWIAESHEDLHFLSEVGQAADLWERRGRPDEEVWRGKALHDAVGRTRRQSKALPPVVEQFLDAGEDQHQRRRRRRRWLLVAGVSVLAVLVLVEALVAVAYRQRKQQAEQARSRADRARVQAETQRARAQLEGAREAMASGAMLEARAKLRGSLQTRDTGEARTLWRRLRRHPLRWRLKRNGPFYHAALTPDDRRVAVAGWDHSVYLLDSETRQMWVLRGHSDQVFAVDVSPDGKQLVSASWSGEIRLWDLASGKGRLLTRIGSAVWGLKFSPDGERLAWGGAARAITVHHLGSGEKQKLTGHRATITALAFAPNGQLAASISRDGQAWLWDLTTGKGRAIQASHKELFAMDLSPDGKTLVTGGRGRRVQLWDVATGRSLRGWPSPTPVMEAAFAPDGKILATGDKDGLVHLRDLATGRLLRTLEAHGAPVDGMVFDRRGQRLVTASRDHSVALWDLSAPTPRRPADAAHHDAVLSVDFSLDDRAVLTSSMEGTVRRWSVASGAQLRKLSAHEGGVYSITVNGAAGLMASGGRDLAVRLWRLPGLAPAGLLRGHTGTVIRVGVSPDGKLLASCSRDRTVRLWDLASRRQLWVLRGHADMTHDAVFSPDGKLLATAARDWKVLVWDTRTGRRVKTLTAHQKPVRALAFSPDGKRLVSAGEDGKALLWDLASGKHRALQTRAQGRIYTVDFSPDGKMVAGACSDKTVRLWSVAGGPPRVLRGHGSEVNSVRYSHDGRWLASGSDDYTVRLWSVATGRPHWRTVVMFPPGTIPLGGTSKKAHAAGERGTRNAERGVNGGRSEVPVVLTHQGWMVAGDDRSVPRPAGKWPAELQRRGRQARLSAGKDRLCLLTHDHVLRHWDLPEDRLILSRAVESGARLVAAAAGGCVVLRQGRAVLHRRSRTPVLLKGVIAASATEGQVLLANRDKVFRLDHDVMKEVGQARTGATAMLLTERWLVLGFGDGNMELAPRKGQRQPSFAFEGVPSSPVVALRRGPRGTLIAGFQGGMVGVWNMTNGDLMDHVRLHGPAEHLLLHKGKLYAASALGDRGVLDLGVLQMDYCALMGQIWAAVPVEWRAGLVRRRPPPAGHRCIGRWPQRKMSK